MLLEEGGKVVFDRPGDPVDSYLVGLSQHLRSPAVRKRGGGQNIHLHAEEVGQFRTHGTDIQKRGLLGRFHQDIEVTTFNIFTRQNGAEDPGIPCMVALDDPPNRFSVLLVDGGWAHSGSPRSGGIHGNDGR